MTRAQRSHPLDPLSAAEIAVAVATGRAAGRTPEVGQPILFSQIVNICFKYIINMSLTKFIGTRQHAFC